MGPQFQILLCLNKGVDNPQAMRAVVGAGTGLGVGLMTGDVLNPLVHATEGGHMDFAPINEQQLALFNYLRPELGRVSVERVCSGYGINNTFRLSK